MRNLKFFGLATLAVVAVGIVTVGPASATELTCTNPLGTKAMCQAGTIIHAESEGSVILHPPIGDIECETTFEGITTNTGSSTETVFGDILSHTYFNCNAEVKVLKTGTFEIHTDHLDSQGTSGNGTITSSGTEITITFVGFHCIFTTNNTTFGTITGSTNLGHRTATIDLEGEFPRTGGRSGAFCGTSAKLTGSLTIDKPDWLDVDHTVL